MTGEHERDLRRQRPEMNLHAQRLQAVRIFLEQNSTQIEKFVAEHPAPRVRNSISRQSGNLAQYEGEVDQWLLDFRDWMHTQPLPPNAATILENTLRYRIEARQGRKVSLGSRSYVRKMIGCSDAFVIHVLGAFDLLEGFHHDSTGNPGKTKPPPSPEIIAIIQKLHTANRSIRYIWEHMRQLYVAGDISWRYSERELRNIMLHDLGLPRISSNKRTCDLSFIDEHLGARIMELNRQGKGARSIVRLLGLSDREKEVASYIKKERSKIR